MGSIPNLHPLLVHFPIALILTAALFDLLAAKLGREGLRTAAGEFWIGGAAAVEADGVNSSRPK